MTEIKEGFKIVYILEIDLDQKWSGLLSYVIGCISFKLLFQIINLQFKGESAYHLYFKVFSIKQSC